MTMIDFQERMVIGRETRKRAVERIGSSSIRMFETSAAMYRGVTEAEWQEPRTFETDKPDLAHIMRRAHEIARTCRNLFSNYRAALAYGLKSAWQEWRGDWEFDA